MNALARRLARLVLGGGGNSGLALNGFLEALVQTFENCRPGLADRTPASEAEAFFRGLYEKEIPRLREAIRVQQPHLGTARSQEYFGEVDDLVRRVLVPAYVRLSTRFTTRERNDFHVLPEGYHGIERVGWGIAGMALGAFIVWAPFIPIWSKEWVLVFLFVGLFFPTVRRYLAIRHYESEVNQIVERADREIGRIEVAYLTTRAGAGGALAQGALAQDAAEHERGTEITDAGVARGKVEETT